MDWVCSILTIIAFWLVGNKNKWGQVMFIFNQIAWWPLIYSTEQWGLIPLNIFMTIVSIRNSIKWFKEEKI